jgi:hypothetical protein
LIALISNAHPVQRTLRVPEKGHARRVDTRHGFAL